MRKFGSRGMWAARNTPAGTKVIPAAPAEIPATAITLTEEAGVRQSELHPLFLANQGGMVMTAATDYGTLHAAGRPA